MEPKYKRILLKLSGEAMAGPAHSGLDFDTGVITNLTTGKTYKAQPFPEFIQNIIKAGGLLKALKEGGADD